MIPVKGQTYHLKLDVSCIYPNNTQRTLREVISIQGYDLKPEIESIECIMKCPISYLSFDFINKNIKRVLLTQSEFDQLVTEPEPQHKFKTNKINFRFKGRRSKK